MGRRLAGCAAGILAVAAVAIAGSVADRSAAPPASSAAGAPGAAIQSSDTAAICTPGWASAHRDVPVDVYRAALAAAGIPYGQRHDWELDHAVALEIGGSNDPSNLHLEPIAEAHVKDRVENAAHNAVCSGQMPLAQAQSQMQKDWRILGRQLGVMP